MKESTEVTRTEEIRARVGEISNQNRYYALLKMDIQYLLTELQALREEVERLGKLLALYRAKRAVDGGGLADGYIKSRVWDASLHLVADKAIEEAELAALSPSPAQEEGK